MEGAELGVQPSSYGQEGVPGSRVSQLSVSALPRPTLTRGDALVRVTAVRVKQEYMSRGEHVLVLRV